MPQKKFFYPSSNEVAVDPEGNITICTSEENISFNKNGKPKFDNKTGESVVELSGLCTEDKRNDRSWAIAEYQTGGYSELHHHEKQTEVYFFLSGKAKVRRADKEHILLPGDEITISPGQHHQVINIGEEPLILLVKCTPAWHVSDQFFVDTTTNHTSKYVP